MGGGGRSGGNRGGGGRGPADTSPAAVKSGSDKKYINFFPSKEPTEEQLEEQHNRALEFSLSGWKDWYRDTPDTELEALNVYRNTDGYKEINNALRNNDERDPAINRYVRYLDRAVARGEIPQNIIVWRGVMDRNAINLGGDPSRHIGKTVTEPGYLSTSLHRSLSEEYVIDWDTGDISPGSAMFRIRAPKGARAINMEMQRSKAGTGEIIVDPIGELEIMFRRGTTLKITGAKKRSDGSVIFDADLIAPPSRRRPR